MGKNRSINAKNAKNNWPAIISAQKNWLSVQWSPLVVEINVQNCFSLDLKLSSEVCELVCTSYSLLLNSISVLM